MDIENTIYYNQLYDLYYKLLTDKQCLYFKDYFFDNLSLGEISLRHNISRNAVFKQIHITINKLDDYEEKLKLFEKNNKLQEIIDNITDIELKNKLESILD